MKRLLLTLLFLQAFYAASQAQTLLNSRHINPDHGNPNYGSLCQQVEGTPSGKIFVYGTYDELSDNFEGLLANAAGNRRFIAAYQPDGQIEWVRGVSDETSYRTWMSYAPAGHLYWASDFTGLLHIGTDIMSTTDTDESIVIGRYDTSGNYQNAFVIGSINTYERVKDIASDANGNVVVLLTTNAVGTYLGLNLQPAPEAPVSMILARYSPSGGLLSAALIGATAYDFGQFSLAPAPGGDWYVGGSMFSGKVVLGGVDIPEIGSGILRWNLISGLVWVTPVLSIYNNCHIYDIASDQAGNVAFAGSYIGQLQAGNPRSLSGYNIDVLVGKMDAAGQILWSRNGDDDSNFSETAYGVTTDADGNVYITGGCKGGLVFENGGVCDSGPYSVSFIARFNADGGYAWANCNGGGTGIDLVVQPDHSIFATGTTATGISASSTNYLNHWANYDLSVQALPKTRYCTGDTVFLYWNVEGTTYPAGSAVQVSVLDSSAVLYTSNYPTTGGSSGVIHFVVNDGFNLAGNRTLFLSLKIAGQNAARTTGFIVLQSPVPFFPVPDQPSCIGSNRWLQPFSLYQDPHLVHWEPSANLLHADSIAAQVQNVQESITYRVFFTDTIKGCVRSDTVRTILYDYAAQLAGPTMVYGAENYDYVASVSGTLHPPYTYQWLNNPNTSSQIPLYVFDTTYAAVTVKDFYGCERHDSLYVLYHPARILRGRVMNPDSTAGMLFTPVEVYKKSNSGQSVSFYHFFLTDISGYFYDEIRGSDSLILVRVRPDTLLHPQTAPTWYTRKFFVQNAVDISLAEDTIDLAPIRLLDVQMLPDSNGLLGGTISSLLPQFQDSDFPVSGLVLWIANAEYQPLRFTVTDENGRFRFENLPFGTYFFMVDKFKINNALAPSITIDAGRPQVDQLVGTLLADRLLMQDVVATGDPDLPGLRWAVSPNPFSGGLLRLNNPYVTNQPVQVSLCDGTGRVLFVSNTMTDGSGQTQVSWPVRQEGLFFLKIRMRDGQVAVKKVVVVKG